MANWDMGSDAIHEMAGGIGGATTAGRWTKSETLAREGDQPLELAVIAAQAENSASEDAAVEECPQLFAVCPPPCARADHGSPDGTRHNGPFMGGM